MTCARYQICLVLQIGEQCYFLENHCSIIICHILHIGSGYVFVCVYTNILKCNWSYFLNRYPEARALNRKIVFHAGPTNSGKTYHAMQQFLSAESGVYCGPLKLLATEVFHSSNKKVGFESTAVSVMNLIKVQLYQGFGL